MPDSSHHQTRLSGKIQPTFYSWSWTTISGSSRSPDCLLRQQKMSSTMPSRSYGIPEEVISDDGPQFFTQAYERFAKVYGFTHRMSSPYHPQANGEAERAFKTIKSLLRKADDPYLALLTYRTTPLQCLYSSAGTHILSPLSKFSSVRVPWCFSSASPVLATNQGRVWNYWFELWRYWHSCLLSSIYRNSWWTNDCANNTTTTQANSSRPFPGS